ncbi:putative bifunctional diguanylate cyclase/phosphodiesterase [Angustibacter aerolatus]
MVIRGHGAVGAPDVVPAADFQPLSTEQLLKLLVDAQREITASGPGTQQVAETIADVAHRLGGAMAAVALIAGDDLEVVAVRGNRGNRLPPRHVFPRQGSLSAAALRANDTLMSRDTQHDPRCDPERTLAVGALSQVSVPLTHDGTPIGVLILAAPARDAFDQTDCDVASLVGQVGGAALAAARTGEALAGERLRMAAASGLTGMGLWRWDATSDRLHWSPEMFGILGLEPGSVEPSLELWQLALHPEDRLDRSLADHVGAEPEGLTEALRLRRPDGSWREVVSWAQCTLVDGVVTSVFGATVDVTSQRAAERQVAHMAASDGLTGLPNRTVLDELTRRALGVLPEPMDDPHGEPPDGDALGPFTALLLLDLDRFKLVNDTLGHRVGDTMLVEIAHRLAGTLESSELGDCSPTVARLGGDEFGILLPWVATAETATDIADWLLSELRRPVLVGEGGTPIVCTGSIGIALAARGTHTASQLFGEADLAMYQAKDAGRDGLALFDHQLRTEAEARLRSERRLRTAMAAGRLLAVYQPIVSVGDEQPVGAEALVRLTDDDGVIVLPDDFIDVAEDTGLIVDIDRWMLRQGAAQLQRWSRHGLRMTLSVNVSARTMGQPGFDDFVLEVVREHHLAPDSLKLELTETSLLPGGSAAQDTMRRLASFGIQTGVDDFGTGYSALSYLHDLPVGFIKVDRAFVSRLDGSPQASAVVRSVVELAHAHGFQVTAEGVETRLQADILREMGCDHAQGWLFGRPGRTIVLPDDDPAQTRP